MLTLGSSGMDPFWKNLSYGNGSNKNKNTKITLISEVSDFCFYVSTVANQISLSAWLSQ